MIKKEDAKFHFIFDNDGTMVDSEQNFLDSMGEIFTHHLKREVTPEEVKRVNVPDWVQILKNLGVESPSENLIQNIIDDLNKKNQGFIPPIFEGIKELIESLHKENVATYVWTGRDKKSCMEIFHSHDLLKYFSAMHFRDTCISKPHIDGLEKMLGDIPKSKIVLLGDSVVDLQGAKDFGIPCLIVDWKNEINHTHYLEKGAAKIISRTSDILEWVSDRL